MNFENGKLKVRLTLLEQCLGTKPGNDELLRDYIVSKSGDEAKMAEEMNCAAKFSEVQRRIGQGRALCSIVRHRRDQRRIENDMR